MGVQFNAGTTVPMAGRLKSILIKLNIRLTSKIQVHFQVMIPDGANVHSMLIGLNPNGNTSPLTVSSGSNQFYQITYSNWSTSVVSISNPQFATSGTYTDSSGRDWSMIDIEFAVKRFQFQYWLIRNRV